MDREKNAFKNKWVPLLESITHCSPYKLWKRGFLFAPDIRKTVVNSFQKDFLLCWTHVDKNKKCTITRMNIWFEQIVIAKRFKK